MLGLTAVTLWCVGTEIMMGRRSKEKVMKSSSAKM